MNGGTISNNDGGDRGAGGVSIFRRGKFIMNGGVITENTANYIQGGVDCQEYIEVSGTATIIGNKGNEWGTITDSDLWFDVLNNNFLTIGSSGLSKSAKIGIYINASPEFYKEFTNPFDTDKASIENFVSNRTKYDVEEIDSGKHKQLIMNLKRAATPTASVASGIYEKELTVKLETAMNSEYSVIYYTLDGSDPVTSETRIEYTQPFKISATTTVKAYTPASRGDWQDSKTAEFVYRIKDADYVKVDEAIAKAEDLNKDDYKDFSAVEAAIKAVVRDKNIIQQDQVDAMEKAIYDAIAALEYKDADYTEYNKAIEQAKSLNRDDYVDFSKVDEALAVDVSGKNITEQNIVDKQTKAILEAIDSLTEKEKPTEPPVTEPGELPESSTNHATKMIV